MRFQPSKPWTKRRRTTGAGPTAPAAPDTPSTPSPADTGTAYYTLLSWVSARATNFDVYLSTVNPPTTIVAPQIQSTSYIPTLLPGTTYYWKIVAFNAGGSATGPVWSFTTSAARTTLFELAGDVVTSRVRFPSLTIHDVLGAQPNTGSCVFGDTAPNAGEGLKIGLGTLDDSALIFGGEIQSLDQTYAGLPNVNPVWPVSLIDHTFRLNKRRPYGTWVETSASVIARAIAVRYAPDFTTVGVQDGLPNVSIIFDGSEDFMTCMRRLATAISDFTVVGKTKVDYARDIKLFLIDPDAEQPDPINTTHPPLDKPSPIEFSIDHSQIRTRVSGKGHSEAIPTDVSIGETILPVPDAVMFNVNGGTAITGVTSSGAQAQVVTYEGVQLGGGGSLVGPGAAPSVAPLLAVSVGAGLSSGLYGYAYTDVTASGESLPSPLGTITVGTYPAPTSAPAVGTPTAGTGPDAGVHLYGVSYVTATGETVPGPTSSVTTGSVPIAAPSSAPTLTEVAGTQFWAPGDHVQVGVTFVTAAGETTVGPAGTVVIALPFGNNQIDVSNIPLGPGGTVSRKLYRIQVTGTTPTGNIFVVAIGDNVSTTLTNLQAGSLYSSSGQFGPVSNTAGNSDVHVVPLSAIPLGPSGTTGRKIYRTAAGGSQLKLLTTISDNSTTTWIDGATDASLGSNALAVGSATANQVAIFYVSTGPSPTTSRNIYRTLVNGSQLYLWGPIADNVNTNAGLDNVPDAVIAGNAIAPTSDTSGLTQPSGQVNAGSTTLLTASAGPFQFNGGWAILGGGQTVRYTGYSGNTLTGIPASGPGAITTTVLYGSQVLPSPAVVGINQWNGVPLAMAKGSAVAIWVQRDDLSAQAALGQLELDEDGNPTDGIREYTITDGRFGEDLLIATCDADLAQFSRPIVSCQYSTRDPKTKAGRTVSIDLGGFGEAGDYTIQSVDLSFDSPYTLPLRRVTASSTAFTLAQLLQRVLIG
ncbi:MAG: hypothetical protein V4529_17075 [Gemmatimonadota bacterium]